MNHTPGKWADVEISNKYMKQIIISDEVGNVMVSTPLVYSIEKQQKANARLIASAPELLEACKSVRALFLKNYEKGTIGYQINEELEQAIARAEGK